MPQPREGTVTDARTEVHQTTPRMWRVLLHNDDFTTQEFVVWVLETVFQKATPKPPRSCCTCTTPASAWPGSTPATSPRSKIAATERLAEQHEFPLLVTMEPEHEETPR